MLFGSWMYYEVFKKNQMHFWVWGVVVCEAFPPSFLCSRLFFPLLSFAPFFNQEPQKFRSVQSTKQTTFFFFFPKQSAVFWLLRMTLLPNMHENVTVCLEAVCRACKFKPQWRPEADRDVPTTRETFMVALVRQLYKQSQPPAHQKHWKNNALVFSCSKQSCHLFFFFFFKVFFWCVGGVWSLI